LNSKTEIITSAHRTLSIEAEAINNMKSCIDDSFVSIVEFIHDLKGRLVISGIGKSAIIAQKCVATLNSTGTPALYMHAAEAIHGDLGLVLKDDAVLCISKSGNSPEIKVLSSLVKSRGNVLIGMVSNMESHLAQLADHVLKTPVTEEACPNNLAPTASTTAQLAMGDTLAVSLMELRGFSSSDFAKHHPGGALGKKLFVKLEDLLSETSTRVSETTSVKEVILAISRSRQGATTVVREEQVLGVITDGDLRRMLETNENVNDTLAKDIMTHSPKTLDKSTLAAEAFRVMEKHNISQIIVTESGNYIGLVHLHDILKEGIYG